MVARSLTPEERDPVVIIIRSGYASRDLFLAAVAQAEKYGRRVVVIDPEGDNDDW